MVNTVIQTDLLINCIKHEFPHQNNTYKKLPLLMKGGNLYTGLRHLNKEGLSMGCPCVDIGVRFFVSCT